MRPFFQRLLVNKGASLLYVVGIHDFFCLCCLFTLHCIFVPTLKAFNGSQNAFRGVKQLLWRRLYSFVYTAH